MPRHRQQPVTLLEAASGDAGVQGRQCGEAATSGPERDAAQHVGVREEPDARLIVEALQQRHEASALPSCGVGPRRPKRELCGKSAIEVAPAHTIRALQKARVTSGLPESFAKRV